jgi:hypothetical protein
MDITESCKFMTTLVCFLIQMARTFLFSKGSTVPFVLLRDEIVAGSPA